MREGITGRLQQHYPLHAWLAMIGTAGVWVVTHEWCAALSAPQPHTRCLRGDGALSKHDDDGLVEDDAEG